MTINTAPKVSLLSHSNFDILNCGRTGYIPCLEKKSNNQTTLTWIESQTYTIWNRIKALFYCGPLANFNFSSFKIATHIYTHLKDSQKISTFNLSFAEALLSLVQKTKKFASTELILKNNIAKLKNIHSLQEEFHISFHAAEKVLEKQPEANIFPLSVQFKDILKANKIIHLTKLNENEILANIAANGTKTKEILTTNPTDYKDYKQQFFERFSVKEQEKISSSAVLNNISESHFEVLFRLFKGYSEENKVKMLDWLLIPVQENSAYSHLDLFLKYPEIRREKNIPFYANLEEFFNKITDKTLLKEMDDFFIGSLFHFFLMKFEVNQLVVAFEKLQQFVPSIVNISRLLSFFNAKEVDWTTFIDQITPLLIKQKSEHNFERIQYLLTSKEYKNEHLKEFVEVLVAIYGNSLQEKKETNFDELQKNVTIAKETKQGLKEAQQKLEEANKKFEADLLLLKSDWTSVSSSLKKQITKNDNIEVLKQIIFLLAPYLSTESKKVALLKNLTHVSQPIVSTETIEDILPLFENKVCEPKKDVLEQFFVLEQEQRKNVVKFFVKFFKNVKINFFPSPKLLLLDKQLERFTLLTEVFVADKTPEEINTNITPLFHLFTQLNEWHQNEHFKLQDEHLNLIKALLTRVKDAQDERCFYACFPVEQFIGFLKQAIIEVEVSGVKHQEFSLEKLQNMINKKNNQFEAQVQKWQEFKNNLN